MSGIKWTVPVIIRATVLGVLFFALFVALLVLVGELVFLVGSAVFHVGGQVMSATWR